MAASNCPKCNVVLELNTPSCCPACGHLLAAEVPTGEASEPQVVPPGSASSHSVDDRAAEVFAFDFDPRWEATRQASRPRKKWYQVSRILLLVLLASGGILLGAIIASPGYLAMGFGRKAGQESVGRPPEFTEKILDRLEFGMTVAEIEEVVGSKGVKANNREAIIAAINVPLRVPVHHHHDNKRVFDVPGDNFLVFLTPNQQLILGFVNSEERGDLLVYGCLCGFPGPGSGGFVEKRFR